MKTRNALVFAALSLLFGVSLFGAAPALAAGSAADDAQATFSERLDSTRDALAGNITGYLGREERNEAGKYIAMAQSLWNNGSPAKAQQFLEFARGKLGLTLRDADAAIAAR